MAAASGGSLSFLHQRVSSYRAVDSQRRLVQSLTHINATHILISLNYKCISVIKMYTNVHRLITSVEALSSYLIS